MSFFNPGSLKFPHLIYDVSLINQRLTDYTELDCFVFLQHFSTASQHGPAFELLAYPHGNTMGSTLGYNEVYYNASSPDALLPVGEGVAVFEAPVILAPNTISKADMLKLIGTGSNMADVLIFTAQKNTSNLIYYTVKPAQLVNGDYIFIPILGNDESLDTNPSPPATIESTRRNN